MQYPAQVMGSHGKNKFYKNAHMFQQKIDKTPKVSNLEKNETFDEFRKAFLHEINQSLFFCLRHESESPSLLITPKQIGENYVLAQSKEQREIMAESTHIAVDQNEKATPKGTCRTLSLASKYKGNFFLLFFS